MRWAKELRAPFLAGLAAGTFVVCVFLLVKAVGKSGDWAAWVQALGSIGAIVGTYAMTIRSERREKRLVAEKEATFIRGVIAVARAGIDNLDLAEAAVAAKSEQALADALSGLTKVYRQSKRVVKLPVGQWPDPFMQGYVDEFRRELSGVWSSAVSVRNVLHIDDQRYRDDRARFIHDLHQIRTEAEVVIDFCTRWMAM